MTMLMLACLLAPAGSVFGDDERSPTPFSPNSEETVRELIEIRRSIGIVVGEPDADDATRAEEEELFGERVRQIAGERRPRDLQWQAAEPRRLREERPPQHLGEKPEEKRNDRSREVVRILREASQRLDAVAAQIENDEDYPQADRTRGIAQQIRQEARKVSEEARRSPERARAIREAFEVKESDRDFPPPDRRRFDRRERDRQDRAKNDPFSN